MGDSVAWGVESTSKFVPLKVEGRAGDNWEAAH